MQETLEVSSTDIANPTLLDALKLSPFGLMHTLISLIAVAAGIVELVRYGDIHPRRFWGAVFVAATVGASLTGFGIFRHGGFGKPHVLGLVTLIVLGAAALAGKTQLFGRASRKVEMLSYSVAFLFHMIPAFTETLTRLPVGNPLVIDREGMAPKVAAAAFSTIYLAGAWWQLRRLKAREAEPLV